MLREVLLGVLNLEVGTASRPKGHYRYCVCHRCFSLDPCAVRAQSRPGHKGPVWEQLSRHSRQHTGVVCSQAGDGAPLLH